MHRYRYRDRDMHMDSKNSVQLDLISVHVPVPVLVHEPRKNFTGNSQNSQVWTSGVTDFQVFPFYLSFTK